MMKDTQPPGQQQQQQQEEEQTSAAADAGSVAVKEGEEASHSGESVAKKEGLRRTRAQ